MLSVGSCHQHISLYSQKIVHIGHIIIKTLQWRHNKRDGVSNHQSYDCLRKRLFRRRSKKTAKLGVTGLCEGNSPVTGEFPGTKGQWRRKCCHLITSSSKCIQLSSRCSHFHTRDRCYVPKWQHLGIWRFLVANILHNLKKIREWITSLHGMPVYTYIINIVCKLHCIFQRNNTLGISKLHIFSHTELNYKLFSSVRSKIVPLINYRLIPRT